MERRTNIEFAKKKFGTNFIGVDEITMIAPKLGVQLPLIIPEIPYSKAELNAHSKDSILILGLENMANGKALTLLSLRERFGISSEIHEPCFYNQDWYLNESFLNNALESKWYLIKKNVFEESRAVQPTALENKYNLPSAILCAYTFFAYWFHSKDVLWKDDFIWCSDRDHNGDRIYVGKYVDIDGVNKNGFSIHRHLALRSCYAAIEVYNSNSESK